MIHPIDFSAFIFLFIPRSLLSYFCSYPGLCFHISVHNQGVSSNLEYSELDLPLGKPGELRDFFCLSREFLNGLLFELLSPDNNRKIFCKWLARNINDYIKKPQGILFKVTLLKNLEISGNFVFEI